MEMRTLVSFEASGFQNEAQWTEHGSPVVPDGCSIAKAIVTGLRDAGLNVSDPVQHEAYGWAFEVVLDNETERCLLQCPGPWLLLLRQKRSILSRLIHRTAFARLKMVLQTVDRVLKHEAKFSVIQWFTESAYEAGRLHGADSPV